MQGGRGQGGCRAPLTSPSAMPGVLRAALSHEEPMNSHAVAGSSRSQNAHSA